MILDIWKMQNFKQGALPISSGAALDVLVKLQRKSFAFDLREKAFELLRR